MTMGKRHVAIGLAALACSAVTPRAGAAQIALGTVDVVLGTPKVAVIQALRRSYRVDSINSDQDRWGVENADGPPFLVVGSVDFTAGRLSAITRIWTPGERETSQVDAARAVIGALLNLVPYGRQCGVEDRSGSVPEFDTKSVAVVCGQRRIFISVMRYQGSEVFSVSEGLSVR